MIIKNAPYQRFEELKPVAPEQVGRELGARYGHIQPVQNDENTIAYAVTHSDGSRDEYSVSADGSERLLSSYNPRGDKTDMVVLSPTSLGSMTIHYRFSEGRREIVSTVEHTGAEILEAVYHPGVPEAVKRELKLGPRGLYYAAKGISAHRVLTADKEPKNYEAYNLDGDLIAKVATTGIGRYSDGETVMELFRDNGESLGLKGRCVKTLVHMQHICRELKRFGRELTTFKKQRSHERAMSELAETRARLGMAPLPGAPM